MPTPKKDMLLSHPKTITAPLLLLAVIKNFEVGIAAKLPYKMKPQNNNTLNKLLPSFYFKISKKTHFVVYVYQLYYQGAIPH